MTTRALGPAVIASTLAIACGGRVDDRDIIRVPFDPIVTSPSPPIPAPRDQAQDPTTQDPTTQDPTGSAATDPGTSPATPPAGVEPAPPNAVVPSCATLLVQAGHAYIAALDGGNQGAIAGAEIAFDVDRIARVSALAHVGTTLYACDQNLFAIAPDGTVVESPVACDSITGNEQGLWLQHEVSLTRYATFESLVAGTAESVRPAMPRPEIGAKGDIVTSSTTSGTFLWWDAATGSTRVDNITVTGKWSAIDLDSHGTTWAVALGRVWSRVATNATGRTIPAGMELRGLACD